MDGPRTTITGLEDPGWLFAGPRRARVAVRVFCGVVLALGLWNLPLPGFRAAYQDATRPIYELVRLEQHWSYFSPQVGRLSQEVWVEIVRTDGTVERWDFPNKFPVFGTFRSYRWLHFDEAIGVTNAEYDDTLDYVEHHAESPKTISELHLIIATSAPTDGSHGPYEPNFMLETVRVRVL